MIYREIHKCAEADRAAIAKVTIWAVSDHAAWRECKYCPYCGMKLNFLGAKGYTRDRIKLRKRV